MCKWDGAEGIDTRVYGHKIQPIWGGEDERGFHGARQCWRKQGSEGIVGEEVGAESEIYSERVITREYGRANSVEPQKHSLRAGS